MWFGKDHDCVTPRFGDGAGQIYTLQRGGAYPITYTPSNAYNRGFFSPTGVATDPCFGGINIYDGAAPPTPTPSPTPTPIPTPATGYVRSTFVTVDATTLYTIHGSNIMLYDTYEGQWHNSTSDADGSFFIDTLPYTIVNAYATYTVFANEFADAELLGVNVGSAGMDNVLRMYPIADAPPDGYVNVFVTTMDDDGDVVRDASITALLSNGTTLAGNSGTYGTAKFIITNNTQVRLSASKTGYTGATETVNTGAGPSYAHTLYLAEYSVTPTHTATTGPGGTVPVTLAPGQNPDGSYQAGYTNLQGQEMMNWLAANGMNLVQLCFMVTIFALLGVKLGK